jgi:tight adherence protein B
MEQINPDVITIGIFVMALLVVGTFFAAFHMLKSPQQLLKQRLNRFQQRFSGKGGVIEAQHKSILIQQATGSFENFVKELIPRPAELRTRLAKTGREISLGRYVTIMGVLGFGTLVLLKVVLGSTWALALLIALFAGLALPHIWVNKMIKGRLTKFITLFPDAIDLIVRGLRSGLPVTETMASVGTEIGSPVGTEFQIITDEMHLGKTMDDALWEAAGRVDIPDFKFFVISLAVQKETGGNLGETLSNLGDILRKRMQMKLKVKAMAAEGKASAFIVGSLPFIMFGFILTLNYDYASVLFTDPRAIVASVIGLAWMGIGIFIMSKMINFEI